MDVIRGIVTSDIFAWVVIISSMVFGVVISLKFDHEQKKNGGIEE